MNKDDILSELDPTHWLYNDIRFAMWPSDGGGTTHVDVKNGKVYKSVGTPAGGVRKVDENGKFFRFDSVGTSRNNAHEIALLQPPELAITGDLSILVGYKRLSDQDSGFGRIISRTNGGTGDDWSITQEGESTNSNIRSRIAGVSIFSTSQMAIGEYHDIAMTYNQVRHKLIIDGVVEADGSRTVTLQTNENISIGVNPGSDSRNLYGDIYYLIILATALSDDEVARFQLDPSQILLPTGVDFRRLQAATPPPETEVPVLRRRLMQRAA